MKLLLDTHILVWALTDDDALPVKARNMILNLQNEIYASTVSFWEIAIKHSAHPVKMLLEPEIVLQDSLAAGYKILPIEVSDALKVMELPSYDLVHSHKDPFDRMLIAQAENRHMCLVTHDQKIALYPNTCIIAV